MKPRTRLVLLMALALGLWWARERMAAPDELLARPAAERRMPARKAAAPGPADVCSTPTELPQRALLAAAAQRDPFTGLAAEPPVQRVPRRAAPAPAAPVVVVAAPPPAASAAPAEPPPPRLPYRLLGRLDEKNGEKSVFLGLGPALITARPGETLEGGFRLDAIGARELAFTHLATHKTVRLAIEGDAP